MTETKTTETHPRWGSIVDAARHCGLSPATIRQLLARKELKKYKPTPKKVLVDLHELDRLIQSRAV
jgi:hypothetical protein